MKILAIHDGHCATAAFLDSGHVASMVSEERFTNKKNQGGFPVRSIEWIFRKHGIDWKDLDHVAVPHLTPPIDYGRQFLGENFDVRRFTFLVLNTFLPRGVISSPALIPPYLAFFGRSRRQKLSLYAAERGLPLGKVTQCEHHSTHAYSALYASGFTRQHKKVLLFTCDDSGDGITNTVSLWEPGTGVRRLQSMQSYHSLGDLYSRITQFMGMKPGEHEYKIMGMAPYVSDDHSEALYRTFLGYMHFDPVAGRMVRTKNYGPTLLKHLRRDLYLERFDNICAAIQRLFEHLVVNWVVHWARKTGARAAAFGGGSFMNVKGNMLISELPELDDVFFCPSAGDESTALGAGYMVAVGKGEKEIPPFTNIYVGPEYSTPEVKASLAPYADRVSWEEVDDIEARVAQLLADGRIVGRFRGPAEWGARALGGRSIVCRADDLKIIHKLNKAIKMRDFWMPFAASVRAEDASRYIVNPKGFPAPFMMLTFHGTPAAAKEIIAGLHPFDHTCRPQVVTADGNPTYHRLLTLFREKTGLGGFLNTSFNLHGFPIVGRPEEAVETLIHSEIDHLAVENVLVTRKGAAS